MNILTHLLQTPLAKALGWTLFHSLWEGALAALVLLAALWVVRSPRARYACACAAMLAVLTGFAITLVRVMPPEWSAAARVPHAIPAPPAPDHGSSSGISAVRMADILPWFVPFWLAGVAWFQVRGMAGWLAAKRLRRRGVCSAPDPWRQRLDRLRATLRLDQPVALLESCVAGVPVVIGYLRPVILLPVGMLAGMPAGQVEAILLHELAHIHRRDYLANLLQTVVESFLFYHPAVLWMSHVIRAEREHCCDDLVVAASGNAHAYAAALATLEQNRWEADQAVLAASGGSLMKRIHRLLNQPKTPAFAPLVSAGFLILAAAGALAAWQANTPAAQPKVTPYTRWLQEDVVYIIEEAERTAFLDLKTDEERDHFIEQFWLRRDPTPGTPENEFKDEHYRRIGFADGHFAWHATPGWRTDRGRIYILFGPPDELESHPDARKESWLYHSIKGIGANVIMDFVDPAGTGDYRMTTDPNPQGGRFVPHP